MAKNLTSVVGATWPALFTFNGASRLVGVETAKLESWVGLGGRKNSSTYAAAAATHNGLPETPGLFSRIEGGLLSPFRIAEEKASAAWDSAKSATARASEGITGIFTGTVSLIHWLVIGIVAAAVIYAIVAVRVVKP